MTVNPDMNLHQLMRDLREQNASKIVLVVADGLGGLPMEFGERLRLTNKDGSLDAEAEVTAVQIGSSQTLVAARFVTEISNWIIKA